MPLILDIIVDEQGRPVRQTVTQTVGQDTPVGSSILSPAESLPMQDGMQREAQAVHAVQAFIQSQQQAARAGASLNAQAAQAAADFQRFTQTHTQSVARWTVALRTDKRLQLILSSFQAGEDSGQVLISLAKQEEAFREEQQQSRDIDTVVAEYCPFYTERRGWRPPEAEVNAAIARLAAHLRPGLRHPQAVLALRQRAAARQTSPQTLLRTELFPHAMMLVTCEAATPQRMRVGRDWVTNRQGKVEVASPAQELPLGAFVRWWFSQVYAAATAILLDEVYPRPPKQPIPLLWREEHALERLAAPESPGAHASAMLTALLHEEDVDPSDQLHRLLAGASPRARELLMLLHQGLCRKEAARVMGISRHTADVLLYRERKKAQRR